MFMIPGMLATLWQGRNDALEHIIGLDEQLIARSNVTELRY